MRRQFRDASARVPRDLLVPSSLGGRAMHTLDSQTREIAILFVPFGSTDAGARVGAALQDILDTLDPAADTDSRPARDGPQRRGPFSFSAMTEQVIPPKE
jgi:hypothetical protein